MSAECIRSWKTCPVHNPDGGLPPLKTVLLCLYGGETTKDGTPFDETDAEQVIDRAFGVTRPTNEGA